MRKRRILKFMAIAVCLTALTGFAGCTDTCTENKNAVPLAGFYTAGGTQRVDVDSLEVVGVGAPGDSVLSSASVSKNELYLPFRIDSDTTRYVFRNTAGEGNTRDTVTFVYSRTPRFVNVECGASYIFDIRDITSQGLLIDSVTCPNGFIDNTNAENLRIYFAVSPEEP